MTTWQLFLKLERNCDIVPIRCKSSQGYRFTSSHSATKNRNGNCSRLFIYLLKWSIGRKVSPKVLLLHEQTDPINDFFLSLKGKFN